MHEASLWDSNCFVTLTYARDALPPNGSLEHRDFQLFLKRVRKHFGKRRVRFYMCGEYGPTSGRAHYHACLFNVDFREDRVPAGKSGSGHVFYASDVLTRLWSHGIATVQDLTRETAGYCARYIMKKVLGPDSAKAYERVTDDGEIVSIKPEYAAMSLKPGIGAQWFEKFGRDVYPSDFVIVDGSRRRPPKYYDKLMIKRHADLADGIEYDRYLRGLECREDSTPERRAVRETVAKARIRNQLRSLE